MKKLLIISLIVLLPVCLFAVGGLNLFDSAAAIFTSGTYNWAAAGSNTIANDSNTLLITWVDDDSGASLALADAADLSADLVVGRRYIITFDANVDTGDSVDVEVAETDDTELDSVTVTSATAVACQLFFTATHATTNKIQMDNMATGETINLDNFALRDIRDEPMSTGMGMD